MSGSIRKSAALILAAAACARAADYFPPPDSAGGWRVATPVNPRALDRAFDFVRASSKNGGLLVVHRGRLVYERYFGLGARESTPNTASCGKSFTSIAAGILMSEHPDLFPDGLDQRVYSPRYLPDAAFPLSDPAKAEIRLGQLLSMTAGIRGNNPGYVRGKTVTLAPAGPDGWIASTDEVAAGKEEGALNAVTLWTRPGEGYSYSTASIHLASMLVRKIAGMELQEYVRQRIAGPLGWGRWGWGYQRPEVNHTPGGGGIALRATDMLRFAYLLLREGRWNGRQVIPAAYVQACRRPSRYNPHYPFTLGFNVNSDGHVAGAPRDAFWKSGSGGHCFYVAPSLGLAFWKLGGRDEQYDPANTGLALPAGVATRRDWKPPTGGEGAEKTLELVVAAVRD
jgi:CubicO group peptidase (beta-lactamase class C family)